MIPRRETVGTTSFSELSCSTSVRYIAASAYSASNAMNASVYIPMSVTTRNVAMNIYVASTSQIPRLLLRPPLSFQTPLLRIKINILLGIRQ